MEFVENDFAAFYKPFVIADMFLIKTRSKCDEIEEFVLETLRFTINIKSGTVDLLFATLSIGFFTNTVASRLMGKF